jgi:RNA polymerase sigma-70 factor (ECF subfamily)
MPVQTPAATRTERAFRELTEPHRRELQLHCYRMLGSIQDAEDLVQETLLAAWRGFDAFEGRASVRSWLYRIATNRCLNALRERRRRPVPALPHPPEPTRTIESLWVEPYPDGPEARAELRETVELAFIVALQRLPPRQRAALVLRDVLGYDTAEAARMLDTTEASVKGALQRARATLGEPRPVPAPQPGERELVTRFADAAENGDVDAMVALLTRDARLTMPPQPLEYQGHEAIATFLRSRAALRGAPLTLVPIRANTQPAFGCYLRGKPYGLFVLAIADDGIAAITWFSDPGLFGYFGLPSQSPR